MKQALARSLLIHAFVLLLIVLKAFRFPDSSRGPRHQQTVWVVESGPIKSVQNRDLPSHSSKSARGSNRPQESNKPELNLGLSGSSSSASRSGGVNGAPGSPGSKDGYDVANEMGMERESVLYPFFDAVWARVNSATIYPEDFVQQRIEGKVTAQIVVDKRGVFTGEIRKINGDQPMLNAFVLATLIHALHEPLATQSWSQDERTLLVLQFEFHLFGPGGIPKKEEYAHLKNVLGFRRDAYVDPALNQAIEKILTRYVPPIIPIPGGVYIDFPRAYQYFKNLGTPDDDELRARRLELQKEEMDRLIETTSPQSNPPQY